MSKEIPLCVDLDGTLIKTDILIESALLLLKKNLLYFFILPIWLLKGKAFLKEQIIKRVSINPSILPFNEELLAFLEDEHKKGRKIVLATASDINIAEKIANKVGLFDNILASNGRVNLSGEFKLRTLEENFGKKLFDYIGNEKIDFKIWLNSRNALIVSHSKKFIEKCSKSINFSKVFLKERNLIKVLLKTIRIHQWLKNVLIFVPLILSHTIFQWDRLEKAILGFLAFSFIASGTYIINDLMDIESDRQHPTKKERPFASGDLSIIWGIVLAPLLIAIGIFLSLFYLNLNFQLIIITYLICTIVYSLHIKKLVVLDIILLATLYTIRIFAGAVAIDVNLTEWLLVFSMFFFLSLACVKRFSELQLNIKKGYRKRLIGRGYYNKDIEQIAIFGTSSGYISVLVMALYLNSVDVKALYSNSAILWAICPLLLFWISRLWLLARRNRIRIDPVVYALEDKTSYFIGLLTVIIIIFSI